MNLAAQSIKSIKDASNLEGKKVLVRVDYNVPLKDGVVGDVTRLRASLETLNYLTQSNAKIILVSHLGRPKGQVNPEYSLAPVAEKLISLINKEVTFISDSIGSSELKDKVNALENGQIALLENIRFYAGEEANDSAFSAELAALADVYVSDAFGTVHRAHASTVGVTEHLSEVYAGLLVQKELIELGSLLDNPERPFLSIVGGSKISSKIDILRSLIDKSDVVLVGGGMSYTFIKAQGGQIGKSICEDDKLDLARELIEMANQKGTALILPKDHICVQDFGGTEEPVKYDAGQIPDDYEGLDIGPLSADHFAEQIRLAKTVLWNGPVGVFEDDRFAAGSKAVADTMNEIHKQSAKVVIGGGDSAAAVAKFGYGDNDFGHISTGGGASLEFLSGQTLPGVKALES